MSTLKEKITASCDFFYFDILASKVYFQNVVWKLIHNKINPVPTINNLILESNLFIQIYI